MNWVTIVWSSLAAASLTLALVHLVIWLRQHKQAASLMFALVAVSAAAFAWIELALMRAKTPEQYLTILRWGHIPVWSLVISLVLFTRLVLRAGRWWLAWTVCGVRTLSLILNFTVQGNLNYRDITGLQRLTLLGETVSAPVGEANHWMVIGQASIVLLIIYIADAMICAWSRGDRRRAVLIGGSMIAFVTVAIAQAALMFWGVTHAPLLASIWYIAMLPAVAYELSHDMLRAAQLANDLRESERRIELAAGAARLGFWTWDIARGEIWASAEARLLIGVSQSEPLNLGRLATLLHPDDRPSDWQRVEKRLPLNGQYQAEYRVQLADERTRWIALYGRTERDDHDAPAHLRGIALDITDRKRAEEKFRMAVEASPSAIFMVDQQGTIVLVNAKAEEMFGYPSGQLIGQSIEVLVPERYRATHPSYRGGFFAAPQCRAMGAGRELFALRKDGTEFPVEVGLNPFQTEDGIFVLGAVIDSSARRYSETEIARLREHLSHVGRVSMMGQLASALAHELSQPLGAILRNAEAAEVYLQSREPDLEELRAIVADIRRDDQRAGEVIERLRGMLKRRGQEPRPVSVYELLEEVAALIRSDAAARHVKLKIDAAPDLPRVCGDRVQLQQVLLNLILNAMDALAGRPPAEQVVTLAARLDGVQCVELAIRDHGLGIAEDKLARLFEPFFTTKSQGMGMGLPISRTIVEAHRGRIWAENSPGGGATFRFTVPIAAGEQVS